MSLPQPPLKAGDGGDSGGAGGDPQGALLAPQAPQAFADSYAQATQPSCPNDPPGVLRVAQHAGRQRLDGVINHVLRRRIMRSSLSAAAARTWVGARAISVLESAYSFRAVPRVPAARVWSPNNAGCC